MRQFFNLKDMFNVNQLYAYLCVCVDMIYGSATEINISFWLCFKLQF